jgi:hypothetical protein
MIIANHEPFRLVIPYGSTGAAAAEILVHKIETKQHFIELTYIFSPSGDGDQTLRSMQLWVDFIRRVRDHGNVASNYKSVLSLIVLNKTFTYRGVWPTAMVMSNNDIDNYSYLGLNKCVLTLSVDYRDPLIR